MKWKCGSPGDSGLYLGWTREEHCKRYLDKFIARGTHSQVEGEMMLGIDGSVNEEKIERIFFFMLKKATPEARREIIVLVSLGRKHFLSALTLSLQILRCFIE